MLCVRLAVKMVLYQRRIDRCGTSHVTYLGCLARLNVTKRKDTLLQPLIKYARYMCILECYKGFMCYSKTHIEKQETKIPNMESMTVWIYTYTNQKVILKNGIYDLNLHSISL